MPNLDARLNRALSELEKAFPEYEFFLLAAREDDDSGEVTMTSNFPRERLDETLRNVVADKDELPGGGMQSIN